MNALVKPALAGEIIAPGAGITLVLVLHPLRLDRLVLVAAAGLTLAELVALGAPAPASHLAHHFRVTINGEPIAAELWRRVRPKPGTTVVVRAVAGNLGSGVLKAVLGIAVGAAALVLAPIIAPILFAGATGTTLALATSLIGAGITIGGQLAINALFPVAAPQLASDSTSSTYSISGGQNALNPYGPVPVNLGKNRVYPPSAAEPYTEFLGADQYLIQLFALYGPNDISQLKLGETLLSDFSDFTVQTLAGYDSDAAETLYPDQVLEQDLSVPLTAAAGWQVRTTDTGIDRITVDVVAPSGVMLVDSSGSQKNYTVSIRVEYSPTGAGAWALLGALDLTARSSDAIRTGLSKDVDNGQYDVRIEKTSTDYTGSGTVQETVEWTALRGFRNAAPINFAKPLTIVAIRIKATAQLNGAIDQLNFIGQSKCKSWNGAAWVDDQISNNPADLYRFVLQHPANAQPVDDSGIDLETIEAWASYCTAQGFAFNLVVDTVASVFDTLTSIATGGRAAPLFRDGKWSVVWDDPDAPIVQHFTPRNSWGFSGAPTFPQTPHALRIRFVNETNGYQQDERVVYDDGYNADGSDGLTAATLFESIELPGQTNPDNVWRHGRFQIAQAKLRPETYSLNVDFEHLVCTRGDRVLVTHDVPEWGLQSGRVLDVAGQTVTLDEPVSMVPATAYVLRFRLADGSSLLRNVVEVDGDQLSVALAPGDADQSVPEIGDLFMFGLLNAESVVLRVLGITPGDDFSAKLTFVDDAPAISTADSGAIPAFDSRITPPVNSFEAAPIALAIREAFAGVAGETATGVWLVWATVAGNFPVSFNTQLRDDGGDALWKDGPTILAPTKQAFFAIALSGAWSFRVRAVFGDGKSSQWTSLNGQVLEGIASIPLGDVSNLRMTYQDNTSALTWDEITDFRDVKYEIRKGDSWDSALVLIGDQAHPPFATYGDGTYWVAGVARPQPGVVTYSTNPKSIAVAGSVLVANVVASHDEAATGWGGAITGPGEIAAGVFQTTASGVAAYYEIPADHVFNVGFARPTRLNATWKATGIPLNQNVLTDPDFLNNPDVLGAASARLVDSSIEVAVAQAGSTDIFAQADAFAPADAFSPGIVYADWVKFAPGVYVGQFFKARLVLISNDASVAAAAVAFTFTADVADRDDHVTNHALAAGGETFTFTPDGAATAVAFSGGPGAATVPNIQVTWDETAGDSLAITGLTAAHVTLRIFNGGVGVARTINAIFQGW